MKGKKVQNYDVVSTACEILGRYPDEIKEMYFPEVDMKYISLGPLEQEEYRRIEKYMEANDDWTKKNMMRMENLNKMLPSKISSTAITR